MTAILYPIAANAEAALAAPLGHAAREREARETAGLPVVFVTEDAGPVFADLAAARAAFPGRFDEAGAPVAPEDRHRRLKLAVLQPVPVRRRKARVITPVNKDGRRWPAPPPAPPTAWRLAVSYWKLEAVSAQPAASQARSLRKHPDSAQLGAEALRAIARQPLRPDRIQRPLDIGLFETPLPESPGRLIADE